LIRSPSGLRDAGLMAGAGLAVFLLPFLAPNIGLGDYLRQLSIAVHHGFSWSDAGDCLIFGISLLAPLFLIWLRRRPEITKERQVLLAALIAAMAITVFIGGKPGAGLHHMLPFAPCCLYLAALFSTAPGESRAPDASAAAVLLLALVTFGRSGFLWDYAVADG